MRGLQGTNTKQTDFLKSFAQIDEHDTLGQRLDEMVAALRDQKAKGRDIGTFLVEDGINEEQKRALLEMEPNYEMFKTRLGNARDPVNGRTIADDNAKFAGSTLGTQKAGQAALFAAHLEGGQQREVLQAEMPAAGAELVKEGLDTNPSFFFGNQVRSALSGFTTGGAGPADPAAGPRPAEGAGRRGTLAGRDRGWGRPGPARRAGRDDRDRGGHGRRRPC